MYSVLVPAWAAHQCPLSYLEPKDSHSVPCLGAHQRPPTRTAAGPFKNVSASVYICPTLKIHRREKIFTGIKLYSTTAFVRIQLQASGVAHMSTSHLLGVFSPLI